MTRRDASFLLPLLAAIAVPDANAEEGPAPLHSGVYSFSKLSAHSQPGGPTTRAVLRGKLPTGEEVELHETTLPPGQMPHPAHKHAHTEFMLIREGTLEFIMDGHSEPLGPGDVAYAASNEMHGLKNTGSTPANYFVIAIGQRNT